MVCILDVHVRLCRLSACFDLALLDFDKNFDYWKERALEAIMKINVLTSIDYYVTTIIVAMRSAAIYFASKKD